MKTVGATRHADTVGRAIELPVDVDIDLFADYMFISCDAIDCHEMLSLRWGEGCHGSDVVTESERLSNVLKENGWTEGKAGVRYGHHYCPEHSGPGYDMLDTPVIEQSSE